MTDHEAVLVVDASVAVKWELQDEDHALDAGQLLWDQAQGRVTLVAPAHIHYEVSSAIAVATVGRQPRLSSDSARQAIQRFLSIGIQTVDDPELLPEAYPLVHGLRISFYDALYVALSRRLEVPLVNADRRLQRRVEQFTDVIWIGNYRRFGAS